MWPYQKAKRTWRRFTSKPMSKVRRFTHRLVKGKGKGGKGLAGRAFLETIADADVESVFKGKGRGKGGRKGKRSSGKGKGRREEMHWALMANL